MPPKLHFDTASLTDPGSCEVNEDAISCLARDNSSPLHYWILCDGLGGHGAGDVAATLAADTMAALAKELSDLDSTSLSGIFTQANLALLAAQSADPTRAKMHTTALLLCSIGEEAAWAHIGDSRLYHFRGGALQTQTLDHSLVQANVNAGNLLASQIRFHEDRNRLLRSLGSVGEIKASVLTPPLRLEPGDAFLLASDGFWELVLESEMQLSLAQSASAADWLTQMHGIHQLRADNVEDRDNYSAIAIQVELAAHD
jgi:PPM family protein phosphatase